MSNAPATLTIPSDCWRRVIEHLRTALPEEGCGLLACADFDTDFPIVTEVFPGRNILASPTRYRMDAREVIDAFRSMRERGLRLAAIFHSHPASPPTLSPTDLREAHYPEAALIVVSFTSGEPVASAWRLLAGAEGIVPERISIHVQET